jgi:AcrR family transcriptional regulator
MADVVTPAKLIEVAIGLFGQNGPDSVGTRAIAEAAGVQMSAITYHFGSKDGLYLACAEHIAATMLRKISPLLALVDEARDPAAARAGIESMLGGLVVVMMQDEIAPLARFVVREQMNPSPAFAVLYDQAIRHVVELLTRLVNVVAHERLSEEEVRIRCMALVGQVFAFRFARASLLRVTGWQSVGPRETALVRGAVLAHTRAILSDLEREGRL